MILRHLSMRPLVTQLALIGFYVEASRDSWWRDIALSAAHRGINRVGRP